MISDKQVGEGTKTKTYEIRGSISVDQHTDIHECTGQQMSMDARQTSTTECVNLSNVLDNNTFIDVPDIRLPNVRPPRPAGPPGPAGSFVPADTNGVYPRPDSGYVPNYAPNGAFQAFGGNKPVGTNPFSSVMNGYGPSESVLSVDLAESTFTGDQEDENPDSDANSQNETTIPEIPDDYRP